MKDLELYNTLLLRIVEISVLLVTILLNALLIIALCKQRSRYATAFFKIILCLSLLLLFHSLISMAMKALPSLNNATFPYQNEITLYVDLFSRYFAILLIFTLALNRLSVLVLVRLNELLFSGHRYIALPSVFLLFAVSLTAVVVKICEMERTYVEWLGFVDSVGTSDLYDITGHCFLAIPVLSVLLHIVIFIWMKKKRSETSKSVSVQKAERRMCVQVVLLALSELGFIASFAVLSVVLVEKNSLYFAISLYNILSALPEVLIPAFVLFGTKGLLNSFQNFFGKNGNGNVLKVLRTPTKTVTI